MNPHQKIYRNASKLKDDIDALKDNKINPIKVGYLGGFFDLLHPGHMELINKSKEQCDFLIVTVNADEQAKRKGNNRPILSQEFRAIAVANMMNVDAVLLSTACYNEDKDVYYTNPLDYQTLDADIAFFGTEYKDDFPSHRRNFAREIVFINAELGFHTTEIIDRVKSKHPDKGPFKPLHPLPF